MRMKINYLKETGIDKLKEADINRNMKYYKKNKNTWLADRYKIGEIFSVYDKKEFERIYQYSTLQYFHKELGIK